MARVRANGIELQARVSAGAGTAGAGTFVKKSNCWLLLTVLACGGGGATDPSEISAQALLAFAGQTNAPLVLDVRSAEEFAGGHVPGAVNVSHEHVAARIGELDPAREVVVYCERGPRAAKAADVLRDAGFAVQHLTGDMSAWREQGLPIER
jgi:rhodanese-related sulfurtransferase